MLFFSVLLIFRVYQLAQNYRLRYRPRAFVTPISDRTWQNVWPAKESCRFHILLFNSLAWQLNLLNGRHKVRRKKFIYTANRTQIQKTFFSSNHWFLCRCIFTTRRGFLSQWNLLSAFNFRDKDWDRKWILSNMPIF